MKKLYIIALVCITNNLVGAASKRHIQLCDPVQAMHKPVIVDSCSRADSMLQTRGIIGEGEQATGTMAEIYQELSRLGYQGYLDAYPENEQESLTILDRFEAPTEDELTCVHKAKKSFDKAVAHPDKVEHWWNELDDFSIAMLTIAHKMPGGTTFKMPVDIASRIADNHGVFGTPEDRKTIAALQMVIPIRFHQRFMAMNQDLNTYQKFMAGVPAVFERVKKEFSK